MDVGFVKTGMPVQTAVLLKKSGKSISARRLKDENHPIIKEKMLTKNFRRCNE